eukprot:11209955-Ditylum_brightwellii.AAC.1
MPPKTNHYKGVHKNKALISSSVSRFGGTTTATKTATSSSRNNGVSIWIEEAEEGFVDHDENLEEGE